MFKKIRDNLTENWVIENMTKVIVWIIIFLVFLFLFQQFLWLINWYFDLGIPLWFNYISLSQLLSFIWVTIAFWYWYKRYERDKELELLDKNITSPPNMSDPDILIFNWSVLYNLKKNNYIKEELWLDLENYYMQNFQKFLNNSDWEMQIFTNLMRLLIPIKNRSYFKTIPDKLKWFYEHQIVFPEDMYPDWLHNQYTLILKKIEDFKELKNQIN